MGDYGIAGSAILVRWQFAILKLGENSLGVKFNWTKHSMLFYILTAVSLETGSKETLHERSINPPDWKSTLTRPT